MGGENFYLNGTLLLDLYLKYENLGENSEISIKYTGKDIGNGIWKVFYRNVFLGFFNENELRNKESATRLETNLV